MTAMLLGSNSLSRLRVLMTLVPSFVVALPRASGRGVGGDLAQHDRKSGAGLPVYSTPRRLPVHPRGRWTRRRTGFAGTYRRYRRFRARRHGDRPEACTPCLLYTSDAADDLLCVDLGGRRTIKKKK